MTEEQFHRIFNINVLGALLTTQAAVKHLGEGRQHHQHRVGVSDVTPAHSSVYTGTKGAARRHHRRARARARAAQDPRQHDQPRHGRDRGRPQRPASSAPTSKRPCCRRCRSAAPAGSATSRPSPSSSRRTNPAGSPASSSWPAAACADPGRARRRWPHDPCASPPQSVHDWLRHCSQQRGIVPRCSRARLSALANDQEHVMPNRSPVRAIVLLLLVLAGAAAIGVLAYNAGVQHGFVEASRTAAVPPEGTPRVYVWPGPLGPRLLPGVPVRLRLPARRRRPARPAVGRAGPRRVATRRVRASSRRRAAGVRRLASPRARADGRSTAAARADRVTMTR